MGSTLFTFSSRSPHISPLKLHIQSFTRPKVCGFCIQFDNQEKTSKILKDTLAERLRRRPAKPMGSPRVGSNPTGVVFVQLFEAAGVT